ncbi:MAG: hypothetical protein HYS12_02790 [Planctomycetes bacterium]|nr:hypothetical protein [Planctomycetota bacterium]
MFTREDLIMLLNAAPFVPFRLHLSDGGAIDVRHRDFVTAGRRYALIGVPDPADPDAPFDRHLVVYFMHVTRAETLFPGRPPGGPTPPTEPATSPAGTPS